MIPKILPYSKKEVAALRYIENYQTIQAKVGG